MTILVGTGQSNTLGGSGGALTVAIRSDTNNQAVFSDFAALEAYTATSSGTADANSINVNTAASASQVFAVGTMNTNNQILSITSAYIRVNNAWLAVTTNLVGSAGLNGVDGNNFEFVDIPSRDLFFQARPDLLTNNLPIIINVGDNTIMNEIWVGQTNPSSYNPLSDAHMFVPASVMAATGSFLLGGLHRISSSGENVTFRNTDTDVNYFPPWQFVGDHRNPAGRVVGARPTGRRYGDLVFEEPSGEEATAGAVEYDLTFTLPRNESVFGVKVVPAEVYTGQIEYRITRMDTLVVSYNQFMDITTAVDTDLELWFPFPTEGMLGTEVTAELYKADGTRLMVRPLLSDSAEAYTEIRFREFTDVPIAYTADDFDYQTGTMALTQTEIINDISVDSLDGQLIYTPSTLGNVSATLTIEPDAGLRGFDLVKIHEGTLTLNTGTGVLINGQSSLVLEGAYQGGRLIRDPVNADHYLFLYQSFSPDFIDEVVDSITANVNAGELTITLGRTSSGADLTTTVTLPSQSTPSGSVTASITRFSIGTQSTSVLQGTTLSGSRVFSYKVNHPEDVNGSLTLTQDGVTLRSDIAPTDTQFNQAITSVTLANNEQVVFELRGVTNEGEMFNARVTIRAHAPAEQLFYGVSSEDNPATVDTSTFQNIEAGVDNQRINITTTADGQYFIILTPTNIDIVSITDTVLSQDVTNIFTKTSSVRTIGGISYNSYVIGALVNNLDEDYILTF